MLPFNAVNGQGVSAAPNAHGAQAAKPKIGVRRQPLRHVLGGQNLLRAGQVAKARGDQDGVAKAIGLGLQHLAPCHAHLELHLDVVRPTANALGVQPLHLDHGLRGGMVVSKTCQHAVPQVLENAAPPQLAQLADPLRGPGDNFCGLGVAQCFKNTGASRQIHKDNSEFGHEECLAE